MTEFSHPKATFFLRFLS